MTHNICWWWMWCLQDGSQQYTNEIKYVNGDLSEKIECIVLAKYILSKTKQVLLISCNHPCIKHYLKESEKDLDGRDKTLGHNTRSLDLIISYVNSSLNEASLFGQHSACDTVRPVCLQFIATHSKESTFIHKFLQTKSKQELFSSRLS